jgi:hypothetical protein
MNTIEFKRTSNVFLNTGILALHHYLERCAKDKSLLSYSIDQSNFCLENDKLTIVHENLFQLLEDVYYLMGEEVYDTSGKNAIEKVDKYFFVENPFKAVPFAKMKTYGLGELITNDPTPVASKNGVKIKFEKLVKSKNSFAKEIAFFLNDKGKKIKFYSVIDGELKENETVNGKKKENTGGESEIFINAGYTKTPSIGFEESHFKTGSEYCYLTGETYKKLIDNQNTSPFFSGIRNFNSHLNGNDKKISWKVMYLSRFAPKFCLYMYVAGLDSIVCYLFESGNLAQLKQIYSENRSIFKSKPELLQSSYTSNFKFHNFHYRKDDESKLTSKSDYSEQAEVSFMLIYTMYRQILFNQSVNEITDTGDDFDPMTNSSFKKLPISLLSFKADKFTATLRPNAFEYFNNFKFAIRLITYLERNGVNFQQVLSSLKFLKPSDKNSKNSYRLERQIRNQVLSKVLNQKSILGDIETLFFQCFSLLVSGENVDFKNYRALQKLVELYQPIIQSKDSNQMREETEKLQEKAIKLGSSIGISIINYEEAKTTVEKQGNAKNGRAYIIGLHKARTLSQFTEAIIRLQQKYNLVFSGELLNGLNEENFEMVRQFSIISALNHINSVLKPPKENNEN